MQEGSAVRGNTLATALLLDQNWTLLFRLIVQSSTKRYLFLMGDFNAG